VGFGVELGVGPGDGRVTSRVAQVVLWLPAASIALICTMCWPSSSLNQRNFTRVSAVVATS
jgi:hypothetical protein